MSAITETAKDTLRLLGRSPKDADGWAKVSAVVWPLLADCPAEFMDREGGSANGGRARFTEKGQIIHDYTL